MESLIQLFVALTGSLGFAMLFNIHGRKLALSAIGGLLSWSGYLIAQRLGAGDYLSAFCASAALTVYSEMMARWLRAPVTVFLVSSAIPLIPGASLYYTARALMMQQWELSAEKGLYTLLFAASMSTGITLTTLVFQTFMRKVHRNRSK